MSEEEKKDDSPTFTIEELPNEMQELAALACQNCPELRSIAMVFDWEGVINTNPDVPMGVWTDELGPIRPFDLDTIRGSLSQVSKMMASQASLAIEAMSVLELRMGELHQELRKLEKYVDITKQDVEKSEQEDNEHGDA
jgi:hypothetical protein